MYEIYKVKPGDSLDLIAKTNNLDLKSIYQINKFPPFYTIKPDSEIYLPNKNELLDYYLVKENDTVESISKKFNVDKYTLLLLNGLDKQDIVYPGDVIIIPKDGTKFYITKKDDNVASILKNTKIDNIDQVKNDLYVLENQLLIFKEK